MSDNGLVIKKQDSLAEFDGERYSKMIGRLRHMIVGGRKLENHEIEALAGASLATNLNPFVGEIYYVPKVGPVIGKQGYARKAQEQLEYEAERAGYRNPVTITVEARPATEEEVGRPIAEGDVAVHVTLTDSLSRSEWLGTLAKFQKDFGAELAVELVGRKAPSWTGVGVVEHMEKFKYDDSKPELYARKERAEKRATKQAMMKRFPRLELPDLEGALDLADYQLTEVKREDPHAGKSSDDLIGELGFPPDQPVQKVTREDVQPEEEEEAVEGEARDVIEWPEETVKAVVKARYIREPEKVVEVLNRSRFLDPGMDQKQVVMWASWYVEARKKGLVEDAAAGAADTNLADWMSAQEE